MKTINNKAELRNLVCTILDSADKTREKLQNMSTEDFLFNGKFGFLGTKWDNPAIDDDLGEQIQQSMTMLMTCYAIDWFYFDLVDFNNTSSDGTFTINDGDKNGVDLSFKGKSDLFTLEDHFTDKQKLDHRKYMQAKKALCEIFTAKNPYNNNKIFHDLRVLTERAAGENLCMRFIFFCSPEKFCDTRLKCKTENIEIIKIDKMQETSYGKEVYQINRVNGEIKLVSGRHDPIQSEIIRVTYKIADSEHRAHIIHITPESLLRWAKGVASDWK